MGVVMNQSTLTVSSAGISQLLPMVNDRRYLRIHNTGTVSCDLFVDDAAIGFPLPAGQVWEPGIAPKNAIRSKAAVGALGVTQTTTLNIVAG